jgi:hypothetical protein
VSWVKHKFYDDIEAGRMATLKHNEDAMFHRCYRHQLAAIKRAKPLGVGAWRGFVAGFVQLLSHVDPNPWVFSALVEAGLDKVVLEKQFHIMSYLRNYLFTYNVDMGLWDSEWRCGVPLTSWDVQSGSKHPHMNEPGLTPASVNQSMERHWLTLKTALPQKVMRMDISAVSRLLEQAVTSVAMTTGRIENQDGVWKFCQEVAGAKPLASAYPTWVSQFLVTGPPELSERLMYAEDRQVWTPPLTEWLNYAPNNFHALGP